MSAESAKQAPTSQSTDPVRDFYGRKSEPAAVGALVLRDLRAGSLAVIDAGVRTVETVGRYRDDPDSLDLFMAVLAEGKFFSDRERQLGPASPKLSKLCAIGSHAEILRSDEIQEHLIATGMSGYSAIYQLLVYYSTLEGDDQSRFERLVALLRARRPSTREAFSDLTRAAKRAKGQGTSVPLPTAAIETGHRFDLMLATLNDQRDRQGLEDYYADKLPLCLRVHERLSEQAVAVVITRLIDLPTVENKLLTAFSVRRILLLHDPTDPDVTEAQVAVVALRGRPDIESITSFQWLAPSEPLDAISLAEQLVPMAQNKLHLFAPAESEGWHSIRGEANWEPT